MDEVQIKELHLECEHIFSLEEWLPKASNRIKSRAVTSHPSKFTHPSTGVGEKNKKNCWFRRKTKIAKQNPKLLSAVFIFGAPSAPDFLTLKLC